jgi:HlyD family secretion protein
MPGVPVDRKITQVWVLEEGKAPQQTTVTAGIVDSLFTEIAEGPLKEGDRVVIGIETQEEQTRKKLPPGFDSGPRMR